MTTTNKFKGYVGSIENDMDRFVVRGKVLFINDLITYEAADLKQLQAEFESAVDDYLATCAQLGRQPQAPMSGTFNVRVDPELHQAMAMLAARSGVTLNQAVVTALKSCVAKAEKCGPDLEVVHTHRHFTVTDDTEQALKVKTTGERAWLN